MDKITINDILKKEERIVTLDEAIQGAEKVKPIATEYSTVLPALLDVFTVYAQNSRDCAIQEYYTLLEIEDNESEADE